MINNTENKGNIWIGLFAIAIGLIPMIIGIEPSNGTPQWVANAALSVFIIAGFAIIFPKAGTLLGPTIFILFTAIASWIGFNPDATACTRSISLPFISESKYSSCGPFAISAVILWIFTLMLIFSQLSKFFRKNKPK